jgi:hypothetical protein
MSKDRSDVVVLLMLGWILTPLAIVGWQIYGYLRHAIWQPLSVLDTLLFINVKWAENPTDWIGLHHVLELTPLSVGIIILSAFIYLVVKLQD